MNREQIIEKIKNDRIVAIIRGIERTKAIASVKALHDAGINFFEVTFNTAFAKEIIAELNDIYGDEICIGAGTILEKDEVYAAQKAGAKFILSPDMDESVIKTTRELGLVSVPGALSATEVRQAQKFGADIVKIFPAGSTGPSYIKDLLGPLNNSQFMAVGGVGLENINEFFKAGVCAAGIGGTLLNKDIINANEFDKLTELGKKFINAIK